MNEDGAEVFDEEDGSPRDLRTWIFHLVTRLVHRNNFRGKASGERRWGEGSGGSPKSFTYIVLRSRRPVLSIVVCFERSRDVPSLPLLALRRWMENPVWAERRLYSSSVESLRETEIWSERVGMGRPV